MSPASAVMFLITRASWEVHIYLSTHTHTHTYMQYKQFPHHQDAGLKVLRNGRERQILSPNACAGEVTCLGGLGACTVVVFSEKNY